MVFNSDVDVLVSWHLRRLLHWKPSTFAILVDAVEQAEVLSLQDEPVAVELWTVVLGPGFPLCDFLMQLLVVLQPPVVLLQLLLFGDGGTDRARHYR